MSHAHHDTKQSSAEEKKRAGVNQRDIATVGRVETKADNRADFDIRSAKEDASARLEKVRSQLDEWDEKFQHIIRDSAGELHDRLMACEESKKLFHDVAMARDSVIKKIKQQRNSADEEYQVLQEKIQAMSNLFNDKSSVDGDDALEDKASKPLARIRSGLSSSINNQRKLVLEKISVIAMVKDDFENYQEKIKALMHRVKNERVNLNQLKALCSAIGGYVQELKSTLTKMTRDIDRLLSEYKAGISIVKPDLSDEKAMDEAISLRHQQMIATISDIEGRLTKIVNMSTMLNKPDSRVENLSMVEQRINANKQAIELHKSEIDSQMQAMTTIMLPYIKRKKALDHEYDAVYLKLRFMLVGNTAFWKKRVGGDVVVIDGVSYRVPPRVAAMIRMIQTIDQKGTLQPKEKLKKLLLADKQASNSVAPRGLFGALTRAKRAVVARADKTAEFFDLVDQVRSIDRKPPTEGQHALKKMLAELTKFAKKNAMSAFQTASVARSTKGTTKRQRNQRLTHRKPTSSRPSRPSRPSVSRRSVR